MFQVTRCFFDGVVNISFRSNYGGDGDALTNFSGVWPLGARRL